MAAKQTRLHRSDYRFLQRFLDVTKANLFFARGVMIVEGDAENILLPTLANLLGRDFTEHGVSIVNVGGVGLRRYARIFQRGGVEEEEREKQIGIPVACMTDLDVMPDCAPLIVGKVKADEEWPETNKRRWKTKKDITDMLAHYQGKVGKASGQSVKTFVSDEWTLEYSLALGSMDDDGCFQDGIAEDVYVAACLAEQDDSINAGQTSVFMATRVALKEFLSLKAAATATENCTPEEVLACCIYAKFEKDGVSKPIAAQYLAERLQHQASKGRLDAIHLRSLLPNYIVAAIDYVTSIASPMEPANDE
jgi:putative ATP-dependent endonuclease of OLD family